MPLEERNRLRRGHVQSLVASLQPPGVIHGDPHLGNYTVFEADGRPAGINLLDYGCIRIFPPSFVEGVIELYRGLQENDRAQIVAAYETWGFRTCRTS